MPPRNVIPGSDQILVPAFFVTDDNAADLERWKQEHPDWFEAGTWKPPPRRQAYSGSRFDLYGARNSLIPPTPGATRVVDYIALARPTPLPPLSALSVASFNEILSAARSASRNQITGIVDVRVGETVALNVETRWPVASKSRSGSQVL